MEQTEFKKQYVKEILGINEEFKSIFTFIDFGNVNHWFEEDRQDSDHNALPEGEKLIIDIKKLKEFTNLFSDDTRFYYGHDPANPRSIGFIKVAREFFGKSRVFTKPIQKIKHYLNNDNDVKANTRDLFQDYEGTFVKIPKCNFDVEMSVDAIRLMGHYKTFCLLSSDADFVHLARYLKGEEKKIVLIKGGHVIHQLKEIADLVVNAQDVKKYIAVNSKDLAVKPGLADSKPESTGRYH